MPTIATGDIDTYYEDRGAGPVLVLVHAATLDHTSWAKQVADLVRDHRVVALDLRGHGRTRDPRRGDYAVDRLAEDLHRFIEAMGLERPVLCGISMGGMVAQTYASRYPGRLSGLVLAGTTTPPLLSFTERLQRAVLPRSMILPARIAGYARLKKGLLRMQERAHGKEAMGTFQVQDLPDMTTRDFVKAIRCFASFQKTQVDLAAITVPTLILCGEKEPAFFLQHAKRLEASLPDASAVIVPGAGHASNFDAPDFFTDALRSFVARVHGDGAAQAVGPDAPTADRLAPVAHSPPAD